MKGINMNRRSFLRGTTALVPLSLIGFTAGTCSTQNGVTTLTVNVRTVVAYASGAAALASAFLGVPGVVAALGATAVAAINIGIQGMNTVAPSVLTAAGSSVTFTFDSTSVPAAISSAMADLQTLKNAVQAGMSSLGSSSLASSVQQYYNGFVSVANALSALFTVTSVAGAAPDKVSVNAALALVHIQAP